MAHNELIGFDQLVRDFERLGKVPQSAATKSSRAGGQIALKKAKELAPVDTGELREGIILKREKTKVKGKAVHDVMMDPAKNDIFVKTTKDGKRYYYPASQEYGFLTVDSGYVPGYRFLRRSVDDNAETIQRKILEVAGREVDRALRKGR